MQPSRHNCVIRCHTSIASDEDLSELNGHESLSLPLPKIVPGDKTGTETRCRWNDGSGRRGTAINRKPPFFWKRWRNSGRHNVTVEHRVIIVIDTYAAIYSPRTRSTNHWRVRGEKKNRIETWHRPSPALFFKCHRLCLEIYIHIQRWTMKKTGIGWSSKTHREHELFIMFMRILFSVFGVKGLRKHWSISRGIIILYYPQKKTWFFKPIKGLMRIKISEKRQTTSYERFKFL